MTRLLRSLAPLLFGLAACGHSAARPPAAPLAGVSTPPYTADQIRDASPAGRVLDFLVEARGQPPVHRVMEFVDADVARATIETRVVDASGADLAPPTRMEASWDELQRHGQFPVEQLTVTTGKATTPAGEYPCHIYTVRSADAVHTFYFADELPGPPVLFYTDDAQGRLMTSTLVRHVSGRPPTR